MGLGGPTAVLLGKFELLDRPFFGLVKAYRQDLFYE